MNTQDNTTRTPRIAVYPGTFDPVTNGHLDIIQRALRLFDQVIVALAINPGKTPLFSLDERREMLQASVASLAPRVQVEDTEGLLVNFAAQRGAAAIVRGLRALSDFDYEFQLALMNRKLDRHLDTVYLMTGLRWIYISSSIIKDVARHGGDVRDLVPPHVQRALRTKFAVASSPPGP
ncbi:MAG: pantetheine-phosphate adenylyltransferase [Desulfobulbaceae bacterium A2]|nr:MAG: pantetheine-phosphate adenylyltransferase [Desulfobulbaceae bacterium A2]